MKKVLSIVLTLAMVLSMLPLAYAADPVVDSEAQFSGTDAVTLELEGSPSTAQLEVSVSGGSVAGTPAYSYTSSNATVASVSDDGLITALQGGTSTVTVRATWTDAEPAERYAEASVTVTVKSLALSPAGPLVLAKGDSLRLSAVTYPASQTVTWASDNAAVTVENGLVTAAEAGTATVTATYGGISKSVSITVKEASALALTPASVITYVGAADTQLTATAEPSDLPVNWSSSNNLVASVSGSGLVHPLAPGTATITAQCGSLKKTCVVQVVGIGVVAGNSSMTVGSTQTLTAALSHQGYTVKWSSSNPTVATVDASTGKVTALSTGVVMITATAMSGTVEYGSKDFTITVGENVITYGAAGAFYFSSSTIVSDVNRALQTVFGPSAIMSSITVQPVVSGLSVGGVLYTTYYGLGYNAPLSTNTPTTLSANEFYSLYFVPSANGGTYSLRYTAKVGTSQTLSGTITISTAMKAEDVRVTLNNASGSYVLGSNSGIKEGVSVFSQIAAQVLKTGRQGATISFSSLGSNGVLYTTTGLANTQVTTGTKYAYSMLSSMTFQPYGGAWSASYTIYDASDLPILSGSIYIVSGSSISYSAASGATISLKEADFINMWKSMYPSGTLSYVIFSAPGAGTLRNNGVPLSSLSAPSTRFYAGTSGSGSLAALTYTVPTVASYGTYNLSYTAYGSTGYGTTAVSSVSGTVTIYVTKNAPQDITYTTPVNISKQLSQADFYNVVANAIGMGSYGFSVSFDQLPDSNRGVLFSSYTSSAAYTRATAGTNYSYNVLSNFRFVPYTNYSGTVTIPFTVYMGSTKLFSSNLLIKVGEGYTYTCASEGVSMQLATFYNASDSDPVATVSFQQPASGTLYYNYTNGSGTKVASNVQYYTLPSLVTSVYAFPLTSVKYIPKANFKGDVTIQYTATTRSGKTFNSALVIRVTSKTASSRFTDVTSQLSWAADSVDFMYTYGIVRGTNTAMTQFTPNGKMTRGDLVLILYRLAGSKSVTVSNPFKDVKSSDYYYDAIMWAYKNGVVDGVSSTKFAPTTSVTREQIAAILYRYETKVVGRTPTGMTSFYGYKDASRISSYATTAMQWAVGNGYITGTTTTTLEPTATATRAQVAVMLHRLLTY